MSYYRNCKDKKEVQISENKRKLYQKDIVFEICRQYFVYEPDVHSKVVITKMPEFVVGIDYLQAALEKRGLNVNKDKLFEKIFIIEKVSEDNYIKYEVVWKDLYINSN